MLVIYTISDFGLLMGHSYLIAVNIATAVALGVAVFAVSAVAGRDG